MKKPVALRASFASMRQGRAKRWRSQSQRLVSNRLQLRKKRESRLPATILRPNFELFDESKRQNANYEKSFHSVAKCRPDVFLSLFFARAKQPGRNQVRSRGNGSDQEQRLEQSGRCLPQSGRARSQAGAKSHRRPATARRRLHQRAKIPAGYR